MTRTLATSWILACAFAVSLAAQPPAQQQPESKAAGERTVDLTGCLAAGSQPDTFRLTHIKAAKTPTAKPGEVVGTTGLKTGDAVQLIGTDAAKLKAHIGHTVTVTGMLVPRKEGYAEPAAKPGTPAAKEQGDMRMNMKSFKHVDATCPAAGK
ncbi:hypothetical protein BH23ACI1_BH23ACI1_32470 [soil metagenome]